MDQLDNDEFEMKPMTAGLGFHKKPVSLKDHTTAANIVGERINRSLPHEAPTSLTSSDPKTRTKEDILNEIKQALRPRNENKNRLSETLPRTADEAKRSASTSTDFEVPIPRPSDKSPMDIVNFQIPKASLRESLTPAEATRRGAHDAKIREFVPVSFSISSTILDAVIVLAFSMIFMMTLIFATGINLSAVIASASRETSALLSLGVLYLAVWQMYVVVARSFFGATLGEWTFDLQLGETEKHSDTFYPARVLLRSLAIIFTGFILLPVASLIAGRDFAGRISGLQLLRRNT
ncbi:MAG: RDD family protein [Bdellovibrionota bacterium]